MDVILLYHEKFSIDNLPYTNGENLYEKHIGKNRRHEETDRLNE